MTTPTQDRPELDQRVINARPHVLVIDTSQTEDQEAETRTILCTSYEHAREVMAREKYALIRATRWGGGMDREDARYAPLIEAGEQGNWKEVNAEWQFSEELHVTFWNQPLETAVDVQEKQNAQEATVGRLMEIVDSRPEVEWQLIDAVIDTEERQDRLKSSTGVEGRIRYLLEHGVSEDEITGHLKENQGGPDASNTDASNTDASNTDASN